ncbi:sugar transferase [Anoxybacillus eryuanensis]|uniref:sugar transferase n=1 Tax=Anoxybacillus eryuanensis TaxID=651866 RepID=UPI003EF4C2B7
MNKLAPIILFVYNRPNETLKTIEALKNNELAAESDLFIFSDAPKNRNQEEKVNEVRKIIDNIEGFKSVTVFKSDYNRGLSSSIINGVTSIIKEFGKVIVLEDDLITSQYFIRFMNEALDYYYVNKEIWSISGYTPKLTFPADYKASIYIVPRACSWGWGTWRDRWEHIDWNITDYENFKKDKEKRQKFNLAGNDMSRMLDEQIKGYIDSWAIRWCYNQFKYGTYTVYPRTSFINNIGLKGDATHGSFNSKFETDLAMSYDIEFENVGLNYEILEQYSSYYNLSFVNYIGVVLKKLGLYKHTKQLIKKIRR